MVKKVALFDFDNTVASGDSIVRLLIYDLKKRPWHIVLFIKVAILYLGYLLHITSFEKAKSALLFPLDVMDDQELEKFYKTYVEPSYYPHVVLEMEEKRQQGYIVILCTASAEAWMKYNQLPIDCLLGTKTKPHSSEIIGINCKGKAKIDRIMDYLNSIDVSIDYDRSYGYSDSDSDLPMLSLVKNQKRILLKTGQIVDFVPHKKSSKKLSH